MNCKIKAATPKGPLDEHPKFADWHYWPSEKEIQICMRGLVLIEQQFHNATPEQQDYYEHTGTGPEKHKLAVSQPSKGQISLHYFSCDSHCFLLQLVTRTFRIIS